MAESHYPGLEIDEDMGFQRFAWRAQRVAWVAGALVLVAALLGVFGNGPLSNATERDGDFALEHDRFVRLQAPETLEFDLPVTGNTGEAELRLSGGWVKRMEVEQVTPEPESVEGGAESLTFHFRAGEGEQVLEVSIQFEPSQPGRIRGTAEAGEASVDFTQWVYP